MNSSSNERKIISGLMKFVFTVIIFLVAFIAYTQRGGVWCNNGKVYMKDCDHRKNPTQCIIEGKIKGKRAWSGDAVVVEKNDGSLTYVYGHEMIVCDTE